MDGDDFAQPFSIFGAGAVFGTQDPFVERLINGFVEGYFEAADDCDVEADPIYEGLESPDDLASPYSMFPESPNFYQYLGSQTVPPCEENVFWNVLSSYVAVDDMQAETLRTLILNFLNPETCRLGTWADPVTGSTTRPPVDPEGRPVSLTGECSDF